jgi:hypothetical protein
MAAISHDAGATKLSVNVRVDGNKFDTIGGLALA